MRGLAGRTAEDREGRGRRRTEMGEDCGGQGGRGLRRTGRGEDGGGQGGMRTAEDRGGVRTGGEQRGARTAEDRERCGHGVSPGCLEYDDGCSEE